jgi:hypothetical protein
VQRQPGAPAGGVDLGCGRDAARDARHASALLPARAL